MIPLASYTGGEVRVFEYNTTSDNIVYIIHAAQHTMNYATDTLSVGSVVRSFSDIISIFMLDGVKIIILKSQPTASLDESSNSESEET